MAQLLTALARMIPAAGTAGSVVAPIARIGASAVGPLVQSTYGPLTRWTDYKANYGLPNVIPPPEALLKLLHSGMIGNAAFQALLRYHGVWWKSTSSFGEDESPAVIAWQRYVDATRPHFSEGTYQKWMRQGRVLPSIFRGIIQVGGIGQVPEQDLMLGDYENVSMNVLLTLWQYGLINDAEFYRQAGVLGFRQQEADLFRKSSASRPAFADALQLRRLGVIDDDRLAYYMSSAGIVESDVQLDVLTGLNSPPSVANLIVSAASQSWDNNVAARWNLDTEVPAELTAWMGRLGLDYSAGAGPFGQPDPAAKKWSEVAWRDHWQLMSFGTLGSVIHRVRGDPANPATWSVPGLAPLTNDHINDVLKQAGVPPVARPYVIAMSFSPLSIRQLRMVLSQKPQPRAWVVGKFLDYGYNQVDAELSADALIEQVRLAAERPLALEIKRANRSLERTLIVAYEDGAVSRVQAASTLAQTGMDGYVVNTLLNAADVRVNAGIVSAVKARARSDWFAGRTNLAGAQQRLLSAGMDPIRVGQTLAAWQAERGEGRIVLATNKILSLLRKGFLSADEAIVRLDNLGWNQPDELLLLAEVQAEINDDAAKAAAAADLAKQKAIREMERLLKENQSRADRIRREMERQTPVASILRWIREGLLTEAAARTRLGLLGYGKPAIDLMLAEDRILASEGKTPTAERAAKSLELQRRLFTPARVAKYMIDGLWTRQQAERKLLALQYTPEFIKLTLDDAELHRKPPA